MRPVMWCLAVGGWLIAQNAGASLSAEEFPPDQHRAGDAGPVELRDAVNAELSDVARALRSLDQSYAYRGMVGCGAWTAGSAYVDWHAKGVCCPPRGRVLPPPPLVLGGCRSDCSPRVECGHQGCSSCGEVTWVRSRHRCESVGEVAPLPCDHVVIEPLSEEERLDHRVQPERDPTPLLPDERDE